MKYIKTYTGEHNAPYQPNRHHLLELVFHTVSLFGNDRLVYEIIMEVVHYILIMAEG